MGEEDYPCGTCGMYIRVEESLIECFDYSLVGELEVGGGNNKGSSKVYPV